MGDPVPEHKTINELLFASKFNFFIPKYQRNYIWKNEKIEELINDINGDPKHFLGTFLLIDRKENDDADPNFEIVDGQQRIITINLILLSIKERIDLLIKNKETKRKTKQLKAILTEVEKALLKVDKKQIRVKLSEEVKNDVDYKSLLREMKIVKNEKIEENYKKRKLYKSFLFITKQMNKYDPDEIIGLFNNIQAVSIIKITVDDSSSANKIFTCLNDRGQTLASIDLIKNDLFFHFERDIVKSSKISKISEKKSKEQIVEKIKWASDEWKNLINNITESDWQDRFLRHYYLAFHYDKTIFIEGKTFIRDSETPKIYEKLAERNIEFIFNELVEKSSVYGKFSNPDRIIDKEYKIQDYELRKNLNLLKIISAKPAYILLLYLFTKFEDKIEFQKEVTDFLIKYFIRRHLTGLPDTNTLDKLFIEIVKKCEKTPNKVNESFIINAVLNSKTAPHSNYTTLEKTLKDDIYDINPSVTRAILILIESLTYDKKIGRDLWDSTNFQVEHILPQGPKLPPCWVNMLADGNIDAANNIKTEYQHKLGNLTLTAHNQELSNMCFDEKQKREHKTSKIKIGYNNNLTLNSDLVNANEWKKEQIISRTIDLVKECERVLKFKTEIKA
ncbi:DUF262 domain-containing protein [Methanoregula sp.]|jgi:uncharacterized protein with ParB-like and HNH nuclease domain|uniref:DUF262 domain-containing protein n=1 Tax=Methanoregula sp. TaxID=2052170 RepID=UPI003C1A63C2